MSPRTLRARPKNISYASDSPDTESASPDPTRRQKNSSKSSRSSVMKNHSVISAKKKPDENLQSTLPTGQLFAPIRHTKSIRPASNVLPRNISHSDIIEPSTIATLFFTNDLMKEMTTNSNLYADSHRAGEEGRHWEPVQVSELRCWIGILIYMGVCRMPAVEDYWKHDGLYPTHHICDYMSLTRFEQIRRYFHVAHPDAPKEVNGRRLWYAKVDPILNQLRNASQTYRNLSSNVSIDECMIRCTGHSSDTYKMPSKPIDQGFKFHCLADAGYLYDFHPTSNQAGPDPISPSSFSKVDDMSNTSKIVLSLLQKNCAIMGSDQAFNVYMNNFYVNLPLFASLRKRLGVGACGTARNTTKDFPPELAVPKNAKLDYHYHTAVVKDNVAVVIWMDNAVVCMMTTIHQVKGRAAEVPAMRKKPGNKSTNASGVKKSQLWKPGEWVVLTAIPACIYDYNQHMGGVDVADQLRCYYETHLTSRRTWYPLFFWALDTGIINAFLIYKDCPQANKSITHKEFRMQVAWEFIMGWRGLRSKRALVAGADTTNKRQKYVTARSKRPLPVSGEHSHLPVHMEARRDCVECKWWKKEEVRINGSVAERTNSKTYWKCLSCEQPLCLSGDRNCFIKFHQS
jgi:hypothetical protein